MTNVKTIYALSSGTGRAGVAVIRMSGPRCAAVIADLCGSLPEGRRASLRKLQDRRSGEVLDEAIVLWLPGPGTVTGEDMAEFHVHGSRAGVAAVLRCLSEFGGCRMAEAGEFSRRGFANGKMDLVEAEGLADFLNAETDVQRRQAMRQFLGEASMVYQQWRQTALSALALVEASIDFVEEDGVADEARLAVVAQIDSLVEQLRSALAASTTAGLVRDGVGVVIAGPPNVGKSSLLNWLARRDAAIVSPIAGTTRDLIETRIVIAGVPVLLTDTAGLRESGDDVIEAIGMERAEAAVREADLLIWMMAPDIDAGAGPTRDPDLVLVNKSDLGVSMPAENMIRLRNNSAIPVSIKSGAGMSVFKDRLEALISTKLARAADAIVVRERHRIAITDSIRILNDLHVNRNLPQELVAESLRDVVRLFGTITGNVNVEDVLGEIFSAFCIGK